MDEMSETPFCVSYRRQIKPTIVTMNGLYRIPQYLYIIYSESCVLFLFQSFILHVPNISYSCILTTDSPESQSS